MSEPAVPYSAPPDPADLAWRVALARRLASEAARVAVRRWRAGHVSAEVKADQTPVTAVDREINDLLVRRLADADPGTPIVGEEGSLRGTPGGWCWFVDPIDGTGDFVAGTGQWMVLLGATFGGRPVLGVAARPLPPADQGAPRLYWASAGGGAWQEPLTGVEGVPTVREGNPSPLHVSEVRSLESARLLAGKSRHREGFLERLAAVPHGALLTVGSLGLKAVLVAQGSADAYASASLQTSVWDLVGPSVIVEEAGGRITDLSGAALTFETDDPTWRRGVIVSNGRVHDALVAAFEEPSGR
jgi:3'-phosphoadenosine 5'-phosphosulfate (PAPS) 3'-phosphatase